MRRMLSKLLTLFVLSGIPAKVKATPFDGAANYTIAPETAAPSLIAALVMGARGYQNYAPPPGWKASFQTLCESETTRLSWAGHPQDPDRAWPSKCDTWGAASTIKMRTGLDWTIQIYNDDQYGLLIAKMLEAVVSWHSPVVIPLWGQADHWAVFFRMSGTDNPPKKRVIEKIWFEDGLEPTLDAGGNHNLYFTWGGLNMMSGGALPGIAYQSLSYINKKPNCCDADPLMDKFVILFAPPSGFPLKLTASSTNIEYALSPPLVKKGSRLMSAQLAQDRFQEALQKADVLDDKVIAHMIAVGKPDSTVLVNGVSATGAPWNYYLITLTDDQGNVVGYVQLSADDGSFERVFVPNQLRPDISTSAEAAAAVAANSLENSQHLGPPQLRWDPRVNHIATRSPQGPFYEFPILTTQGDPTGQAVRVSRLGGMLMGRSKITNSSVADGVKQ